MILAAALAASPAIADVFMFQTPSGNIVCSVGLEQGWSDIQCTIHERYGPPAAPAPAGCPGPWGHNFEMAHRGPVTMSCGLSGSPGGVGDVAGYGQTGEFGGITCVSSQQGLDCRNLDGHGFFLSRQTQSAF